MAALADLSQAGNLVRLKVSAPLRKSPAAQSPSFGTLAAGTVLTFEGQIQKGFVSVSAEVANEGRRLGWVFEDEIENSEGEKKNAGLESLQSSGEPEVRLKRKRVSVPDDEALLLRREASFFYGIQAGPNFSFIKTEINNYFYYGAGFTAGGLLGFYLGKQFPIRLEVNFSKRNAESPEDTTVMSFNFLDVAILSSYLIKSYEFSIGAQYAMGLGLGQIPRGVTVGVADELSHVALAASLGYRFSGAHTLDYVIRFRYDVALVQSPFSFQQLALTFTLEFSG